MKRLLVFLIIFLGAISTCWSQQYCENEFHSTEEKLYRNVLKTKKVKRIKTFYHYKKSTVVIPDKIYELDKDGNILIVIEKANQTIKTDVIVERKSYDKKGNLISHVELNNTGVDTMKFVIYQYDSLNNLTLEIRKEADYQMGSNNKLERFYKHWTYAYENKYNLTNRLITQLKRYNSNLVLRSELLYDGNGNLIEIKRYLKETQCLEDWIKLSYYGDNYLKEKFYPNHSCGEGNYSKTTMNSNRYIYKYNPQKQFTVIEHTNLDQWRGKMVYTYNSAGLLIYIARDKDFGYADTSLKYEFYK